MKRTPNTTTAPTGQIAPFGLRLLPELREKIESAAKESGRSMNAEISARLAESFEASPSVEQLQATIEHLSQRLADCQYVTRVEAGLAAMTAMSLRLLISSLPPELAETPNIKSAEKMATSVLQRDLPDFNNLSIPEGAARVDDALEKMMIEMKMLAKELL